MHDGTFAVQRIGGSTVDLIIIDFESEDKFRDKIVYQEFAGKLVSMNGNRDRLYLLIQLKDSFTLKIFDE